MTKSLRWMRWPVAVVVAVALGACAEQVTGPVAQPPTVTGAVGQQVNLDVTSVLNTVWDSVPQVSSGAVRFLSTTQPAALYNPGGPTQRFTFQALTMGRATITLRRAGTSDVARYIIEIQLEAGGR